MRTSEQINDLADAMCKAQSEMKPAMKDSLNPHFNRKYADLTSVWDACRGPLTGHGLTVWQDVTTDEKGIAVSTRITHTTGQWVEFGPLTVPLTKLDAQGVGSAASYAKRYALSAAVGVVAEDDDDGNAAVGPKKGGAVRDTARSIPSEAPKASGVLRDLDGGHEVRIDEEPDVPAVREVALNHIKEMADALGLKPEGRAALWKTHVGNHKPESAPVEKLRLLESSLAAQCEREGK